MSRQVDQCLDCAEALNFPCAECPRRKMSEIKVVDQGSKATPSRLEIELAAQKLEDLLNTHGGNLVVVTERVCDSAIGGPMRCSHTLKVEMDWS